ncbi:MAG TPA: transglutaminase family protein [Steroidobacteraceae bacterium]|jgi:transglutaminase-like putative cysteine protease
MRRLGILHRTYYNYSSTVQLGPHRLLLRPREGHVVRLEFSRLETTPPSSIRWVRDAYDNSVAIATFTEPANQLQIVSELIVQHYDERPLDFLVADYAVDYPFAYEPATIAVLQPYLLPPAPPDQSALHSWVAGFWEAGEPIQTYVLLQRLCSGIQRTLSYQVREQPGVQTAAETLARGIGSCRDFSTLFMEAARSLGLAARFVSGYLYAPPADGSSGASHAWAEVYLPGAGWKGFDPTTGQVVGSDHIAVAVARLPDEVSPVTGSYFGSARADLEVGVWLTSL